MVCTVYYCKMYTQFNSKHTTGPIPHGFNDDEDCKKIYHAFPSNAFRFVSLKSD